MMISWKIAIETIKFCENKEKHRTNRNFIRKKVKFKIFKYFNGKENRT